MILGIYVTLGVFLLLAARDPIRHLSLIWFTVWSSIVHAVVMAVHSVTDPGQIGHLWGDVAALLLTAAVLAAVRDRQSTRLNSSHGYISYAVFCLKKKNQQEIPRAQRLTSSTGTL